MGSDSNSVHTCRHYICIMFGDLKSAAGVKALNEFLAEHSYIEGYVPSQADTAVFEALAGAPKADTPHALRWYNHIKSFGASMKQFAKASKNASDYSTGAAAAPASMMTTMTLICSAVTTKRSPRRRKG